MNQNESTVNLFLYQDGTVAAHSGDIRGLVIEAGNFEDMRSELIRVASRLLQSNHGLTEQQADQASIRLVLCDGDADAGHLHPKLRVRHGPQLL